MFLFNYALGITLFPRRFDGDATILIIGLSELVGELFSLVRIIARAVQRVIYSAELVVPSLKPVYVLGMALDLDSLLDLPCGSVFLSRVLEFSHVGIVNCV